MSYSHKNGFGWPHVLFILLLITVLFFLIAPLGFSRKGGPRTEALNNAKAISGALSEFKTDRGAYPCAFTLEALRAEGHTLPAGTDANAYLAQLLVTEVIDSETYFYANRIPGIIKGDDDISSADKLLATNENGFAYIMTTNEEPLSDVKSITPLVIAPIHSNAKIPTFDPTPYQGYYVYGAADGSGKQGKIGKQAQALSKGRTHLFETHQTSPNPLFGEEIPIIKMPRLITRRN